MFPVLVSIILSVLFAGSDKALLMINVQRRSMTFKRALIQRDYFLTCIVKTRYEIIMNIVIADDITPCYS